MGDHEDASRLIVKYCPRASPEWQRPGSDKNTCRHCDEKFKGKNHQHNCRLCGHLFCSMCTKKYHVPQEFKRKDKSGPVRVCLGCRDQALIRRQKVEDTPVLRPHQIISVQHGKVHIHPPTWVPENAYNHCYECRESTGAHPFFCRLCGEMFCTKCSVKLDVPNAFRKKRNKSGPVRCCIECRYKVYAKVELDETPLSKLKEQEQTQQQQRIEDYQMSYDNEGGRPKALAGSMAQFAPRIPNSPLRESDFANRITAPPKSLQVYQRHHVNPHDRAQYNDQFLAQIEVPGDSNLVEIHERVMKSCSTLRNRIFYYICRNKPCFTEHWDMFSMKYFPQVVVVEGSPPGEDPDEYARAFQGSHTRSQPTPSQTQLPAGDSGPPPPNFPRQQSMNGHRVSGASPDAPGGAGGAIGSPSFTHPRQLQKQATAGAGGGSMGMPPGSRGPSRSQTSMGSVGGPPSMPRSSHASSHGSTPASPLQRSSTAGVGGARMSIAAAGGPTSQKQRKRQPKYADAIWVKSEFDYTAQTDTNMTIYAGQTLACFAHDPKEQWWFGESLDERSKGWFPAAYVTECEAPDEEDDGMPKGNAPTPGPPSPPAAAAAGVGGPPPAPVMGMRGPPTPPAAAGGPPPPPAAAAAGGPPPAPSQFGNSGGYPPQPQGGGRPSMGGYPPQAAAAHHPMSGGRPSMNNGYPPQPQRTGGSVGGFPSRQSSGYPPQPASRQSSGYPPQWQQHQNAGPPPAPAHAAAGGPPPPPGAMGGPALGF